MLNRVITCTYAPFAYISDTEITLETKHAETTLLSELLVPYSVSVDKAKRQL